MNEDLLWRVLKRILQRQCDLMAAARLWTDKDQSVIEEIDRELEAYEEAKHG